MANEGLKWYQWLGIILLVVMVIIIFPLLFGQVSPKKWSDKYDELKESLQKAKHRNEKLRSLLEKKINLKQKLAHKFKWAYFFVRVILVILWLAVIFGLFKAGLIKDHWEALKYSELMVFIMILFHFITFGTLTNLTKFLDSIKTRLENWVYGKYVNIDDYIEADQKRLEEVENDTKKLEQELEEEKMRALGDGRELK
jgi:ABC-type multidrug transport system fused ATPase/permease subunit